MSLSSKTLVIGAAGAVGKRLCAAAAAQGRHVIASDRMQHLPGSLKRCASVCVGNVDVTSEESVANLIRDHADADTTIWNLASPLSVETALNPEMAERVTIGGMQNVLSAMRLVGCRRICFTDSIGSFGATSPRRGVTAGWLVDNPTQDPGSDYGLQKRACRELMDEFAREHGGDSRFAILPGVLHSEPVWGNGTTEYALDALLAASRGEPFTCPVDPDVELPMVFSDDLCAQADHIK
jgi:threonine 3-dehydrogenase